jgi:hypothetical protein
MPRRSFALFTAFPEGVAEGIPPVGTTVQSSRYRRLTFRGFEWMRDASNLVVVGSIPTEGAR